MSTSPARPQAGGRRRAPRQSGSWADLRDVVATPVRLLTPLGRGSVVAGLLMWALAARFSWQEFAQLAGLVAGLVALAVLWQLLPGVPRATLSLRPRRVVEGGAPAAVDVGVQAGAVPMLHPKVAVPAGPAVVELRLPVLAAFARRVVQDVQLPGLPRGVHTVGPLTYEKRDPVGLVRRRIEVGDALQLFVTPRVVDLPVFARGMANDLDGAASQQLSMSDLAFHALREYVPGDDLRHVHWRSSAKAGELLVRQFHESRRGHVTVLLDPAPASYPRRPDFELAVSVATSLARRAVRDDFDTYLRCGPHVASGRDASAMSDTACRFELAEPDPHPQQVAAARQAVGSTGLVVQVTGGGRDLAELDALAGRFGRGVDRLVVRADGGSDGWVRDRPTLREVSVPDLARLGELLSRGMR